jgi:crotonobetainyl-CoA:carnitine CoA-transferase CaiB-like acyl-CoA transferase
MNEPPLSGVRVIEFATLAAGPAAGMILGSLGAEVVKVEPPGGDPGRGFSAPGEKGELASGFVTNNAGKRSLILDLATPDGAAVAQRMMAGSDVVLENFRHGALTKMGIDIDRHLEENPQLIWITLAGYGPEGAWRDRRAVDGIIQADSGMISSTGHWGERGVKAGYPVVDYAAGHVVVGAVLAALLARARGPQPAAERRHVVAMFDVALSLQSLNFAAYLATRNVPPRVGNKSPLGAPNESLRTSDGEVMIAAYLPQHWVTLCGLLGCEHLLDDPRFATRLDRLANRMELVDALEEYTTHFTAKDLFKILHEAGVMASVIQSYADVISSDQVTANDLVMQVRSPAGTRYDVLRPPLHRMGLAPTAVANPGQDSRQVLIELGYNATEVERLVASGVVSGEA